MRSDMPKKLVERPRWRWDAKNRTTRRNRRAVSRARSSEEFEALTRREHIRPRHGCSKALNENLKPLERFLERSVGRHWDAVYSEIRQNLSPRSAIHMHIMQHLWDFVTVHTEMGPDGVRPKPHLWFRGRYYVDPRDGVLRAFPRRARPRYRVDQDSLRRIDRGDGLFYLQLEGVWYAVQTAEARPHGWDVVRRHRIDRGDHAQEKDRMRLYGRRDLAAITKRQLGKRELDEARLR